MIENRKEIPAATRFGVWMSAVVWPNELCTQPRFSEIFQDIFF